MNGEKGTRKRIFHKLFGSRQKCCICNRGPFRRMWTIREDSYAWCHACKKGEA